MTTTERLNAIVAKCRANLALAEKRTPGEWREMEALDGKQYTGKFVEQAGDVNYVIAEIIGHQPGEQHDAAYIAACAGAAEAGWRSTIAAIEVFTAMVEIEGDTAAGIVATNALSTILAAWPEDLL